METAFFIEVRNEGLADLGGISSEEKIALASSIAIGDELEDSKVFTFSEDLVAVGVNKLIKLERYVP